MKEKEGTTRRAKKFNSEELLKNLAKAMERLRDPHRGTLRDYIEK